MKRNLLLSIGLLLTTFLLFNSSTVFAQACDATIDAINAPEAAPTDDDGNSTACFTGADDDAYEQAVLPTASLPDVSYIVEYSNGMPIDINQTAKWNSIEKGLQPGDSVNVYAFTYDLESINGALQLADSLCPTLDVLFEIMPCNEIENLYNGVNDGEPGLQNLGEALDLASALTGVVILSADSAVSVLNGLNEAIAVVNLVVCFNYTEPYTVHIVECEANPDDLDSDGIANADEDVDGDGDPTNDDTDEDGIANQEDNDDDGDGILTGVEASRGDTDGDGTDDTLDNDDDGDGILTADEAGEDTDSDGITNALDNDDDGDGIPTADEAAEDTDGDGITNALDDDDNDDGIPTADQIDADADSDGIPDYIDTDIVSIFNHFASIQIYPNPNQGVFVVDLINLQNIEVFNHIGQAVNFELDANKVQLSNVQKGMYFVKAYTSKDTYIAKIMVD